MKLIDEKGKLFGKLNIIDALVVCLLVVAVALVGYKLTKQDGAGHIPTTKLTYTAMVSGVTPQVYEEILQYIPGDQLMASGEMLDAYITDVSAVTHVGYSADSDGVIQAVEEEGDFARLDVTFTIEAMVASAITNEIGTQEVRVGKSHILKTSHFEFAYSVIQTCQWG